MKIVHYVLGISWWRYIAVEQDPHNMFSFLDELSTINARSSGSIALPKAVFFFFFTNSAITAPIEGAVAK